MKGVDKVIIGRNTNLMSKTVTYTQSVSPPADHGPTSVKVFITADNRAVSCTFAFQMYVLRTNWFG
ncbi:hypothetical protein O9993_16595 [Vibrio lentus]|nr:hypothetical protein [Vibrio lentus]